MRPPVLKVQSQTAEKAESNVHQLSKVSSSVYISGYEASKSLDLLTSSHITHILNLAGEIKCPNAFSSTFHYYSLKMPDNPKIDILFFLYFALDFILESLKNNGKVLVHCIKGTSRAVAVALAYLILQGYSENEAYGLLGERHPNIDPNLSFVCQLRELTSQKEETRIFYYSDKYEMFVNIERTDCSRIEITGSQCRLFIHPDTSPTQEQLAFQALRLWEKFNTSQSSLVYM